MKWNRRQNSKLNDAKKIQRKVNSLREKGKKKNQGRGMKKSLRMRKRRKCWQSNAGGHEEEECWCKEEEERKRSSKRSFLSREKKEEDSVKRPLLKARRRRRRRRHHLLVHLTSTSGLYLGTTERQNTELNTG